MPQSVRTLVPGNAEEVAPEQRQQLRTLRMVRREAIKQIHLRQHRPSVGPSPERYSRTLNIRIPAVMHKPFCLIKKIVMEVDHLPRCIVEVEATPRDLSH